MKKLVLSIAILAVMTFAACSEDEKDYTPHYVMCQHCDIPDEEGYEVCTGDNGNAYVGNADTGIVLEQYFALFCDNEPSEEEPGETTTDCVTCSATELFEEEEVCVGTNGHAFVEGTDTGIPYAQYISVKQTAGSTCE